MGACAHCSLHLQCLERSLAYGRCSGDTLSRKERGEGKGFAFGFGLDLQVNRL